MVGIINIRGVIGNVYDDDGKLVEKGIELVDVISQVKKQLLATSFEVRISSVGGLVSVGEEICEYLKSIGKPLHTIGSEVVASIAAEIFMMGHTRELKTGTQFMIHLPSGGVTGTSQEIAEYSSMMNKIVKHTLKFYTEKTKLTESELLPLLEKETFLSLEQCFDLGFTTVRPTQLKPVAYFKTNKKINDMTTKKKNLWDEIKMILSDKPTSKMVYDAANVEIDFFELGENDAVAIGAKANVDSNPANGDYKVVSVDDSTVTLTYVFTDGTLTEIIDPSMTDEANQSILDAITQLKKDVDDLKGVNQKLESENATMKLAFGKLLKLESTPPTARQKSKENEAQGSKFSNAIAKLKTKK